MNKYKLTDFELYLGPTIPTVKAYQKKGIEPGTGWHKAVESYVGREIYSSESEDALYEHVLIWNEDHSAPEHSGLSEADKNFIRTLCKKAFKKWKEGDTNGSELILLDEYDPESTLLENYHPE